MAFKSSTTNKTLAPEAAKSHENAVALFTNGIWSATAAGTAHTIECLADGSSIVEVAEADAANIEQAIVTADTVFWRTGEGSWASWSTAERSRLVLDIGATTKEHKNEFAWTEVMDTSKRLSEVVADMGDIIACFEYFGKLVGNDAGRLMDADDPTVVTRTVRGPVGVCGLTTPWSYPLLQTTWKVTPCLTTGNTFVLELAELTPHTAILFIHVVGSLGVLTGVANLITGAGVGTGVSLPSHPKADMVPFIGGLVTGKIIVGEAAKSVKKVALELGGKDSNITFVDADYEAALGNALNAALLHSGQTCSAGVRLVVEESITERFVDDLVGHAGHIQLDSLLDKKTRTGALISKQHLDKVAAYVDRAREQGAHVRMGGEIATGATADGSALLADGYFYLPAVIDRATREMDCIHDETFGPVVTVETFITVDETIEIGNDTECGLAGAVWTSNREVSERVSRGLRHGTVWINDFSPYPPQAERGGFGQSGIGRELGPTNLEEYAEAKLVYKNTVPAVTGWFEDRRQVAFSTQSQLEDIGWERFIVNNRITFH